MDFSLYCSLPQGINVGAPFVAKEDSCYANTHFLSEIDKKLCTRAKTIIIGFEEEQGSCADSIRKELYQLSSISADIVDIGNLKLFDDLAGRVYALEEILQEVVKYELLPVFLNLPDILESTIAKFYINGAPLNYLVLSSTVDFRHVEGELTHDRCLDSFLATNDCPIGFCYSQVGYQTYFTSPEVLEDLRNNHFELVRLGQVRANMQHMEPYFRDAHVLSVDMQSVKHNECPAQKRVMSNGLYGEEFCQLMHYGGQSINLKAVIYRGMQSGPCDDLSAGQVAQSIWLLLQAYLNRVMELPSLTDPLFKRFVVSLEKS